VKRRKAVALVSAKTPVVSTQVVNEVCVNLIRKAGFDDARIERLVRAFYRRCVVVVVEQAALIEACRLRTRYSLSHWDSLIVAAARAAGCAKLYSEDLCDGQVIDGVMTIVNPFREAAGTPN
jgi:predicted nucleic acid-binding protein